VKAIESWSFDAVLDELVEVPLTVVRSSGIVDWEQQASSEAGTFVLTPYSPCQAYHCFRRKWQLQHSKSESWGAMLSAQARHHHGWPRFKHVGCEESPPAPMEVSLLQSIPIVFLP
jgi:hypothetical protein